MPEQVPPVE